MALFCTLSTLWIATVATARPPSQPTALDPADFRPVVVGTRPNASPTPRIAVVPPAPLAPIGDFAPEPRTFAPRSALPDVSAALVEPIATPKPTPKATTTPRPKPTVRPAAPARSAGQRVSGTATWYCQTGVSACHHSYPGGMYAAAGSELRIGAWRGRLVHVCMSGHCIDVRLIDWCACGGARIIDLYSDAFRRLAPLSAGMLHVTVSW